MVTGDRGHVEELLPAYALDIADEVERAEVKGHLAVCPHCRGVLQEYEGTIHELGALAPLESPPLRVRTAIFQATRPRRRWDLPWSVVGLGAAASLLTGLALGLGLALFQLQGDLRQSQVDIARLEEATRQDRLVAYLAASPETKVIALKPTQQGDRSYAMLMGPSTERFALLVGGNMTDPGPDRVYQLWITVNGERVSGGTFSVDQSGWGRIRVQPPAPLEQVQRVGVTVEPAEGSPWPTSAPVLVWARP